MIEMAESITLKKMSRAAELVSRLERISADSYWAHRAGGLRVAILRQIDRLNTGNDQIGPAEAESLETLLEQGYWILENAAQELCRRSVTRGKFSIHR